MARSRRRATSAALAFLVIAAIIAIVWWRRGDRPDEVAAGSAPPPAKPVAPTSTTPPHPVALSPVAPEGAPPLERLKREYENYKKASRYPHWSIPLTPDMDFALKWNDAVNSDLELGDGLVVRFEGNTGRVFGNEPYVATIKAWRVVGDARRALPIRVTRAVVSVTNGGSGAVGEAFEVTFHDDGQGGDKLAGDLEITTKFVPAERAELKKASAARIEAYVDIDGDKRQLVRDFVFAPHPVLEVRAVHDRVKDGALVATVDREVLEKGVYTFYANLVAGDGSPIAMTKLSFPLEAGARSVELVFFGKVIADRGLDGPYTIRDLHGLLRGENDAPDVWWSHPTPYTTTAYAAHDFSSAEWNDPERAERLANFERVIREMEGR